VLEDSIRDGFLGNVLYPHEVLYQQQTTILFFAAHVSTPREFGSKHFNA
jgi:hypothetical protein